MSENVVEFLINKLPDKSYISVILVNPKWWPKELYSLLNECLRVDPRKRLIVSPLFFIRKSASELLCHTFFSTCTFSSCNVT
ncbi:LOW QUALITY PROTEIN: hypothetical protein HZS_7502 [Henneguya salminicola]|nr:LOW QUALITY PROTEIN: hypothetical protein HZS_7502 [Henneguya salminicola]